MTKIEQRYNIAYYTKRMKQNRILKSFLIKTILENKEKGLNFYLKALKETNKLDVKYNLNRKVFNSR